jgi:tetratricopeptide (TPR) repeat protein
MLFDKTQAVNQTSYEAGAIYGERISPSYYTITREFYNKPKRNRNLSAGVRKSEVADWTGAIDSWTKALSDRKRKVARRAAYNIAVGYEVLGDLQKAKEWAAKAYTEYGEKMASDYFNQLVYRINEEAAFNHQETTP